MTNKPPRAGRETRTQSGTDAAHASAAPAFEGNPPSVPEFDIEKYRRRQPSGDSLCSRSTTSVAVRKVLPNEFVRCHPTEAGFVTELFLHRREVWLVEAAVAARAGLELKPYTLHPTVNRDGVFFLG